MIYAEVLGDPVAHSKSPAIHRFWFERLWLHARYERVRVSKDGLAGHLKLRRSDHNWRGCNLTMPLKEAAVELVDSLSKSARASGAVNLITRCSRGLNGDNVDGAGFLDAVLPFADRHQIHKAILIGAGGAARGIAHALSEQGFHLDILARSSARATRLVQDLNIADCKVLPLERGLPVMREPAIVINATPLGMRGFPELELDLSGIPTQSLIVDIVTDPLETGLIKNARTCGLTMLDGLHMLIGQAALSFDRLFGVHPPRKADGELRKLLRR